MAHAFHSASVALQVSCAGIPIQPHPRPLPPKVFSVGSRGRAARAHRATSAALGRGTDYPRGAVGALCPLTAKYFLSPLGRGASQASPLPSPARAFTHGTVDESGLLHEGS